MDGQSLLSDIQPLSQVKRLEAREQARAALIRSFGERPSREAFDNHTTGRYPTYVTRTILFFCVLAMLAAFTPSAIRLYHIGSQTFGNAVSHVLSMQVVGIAVVVLAEASQLVFSLSLATLGTSRTSRFLLYFGMVVATAIALVGNVQVALPDHWTNPFAWLEAMAPPLLVLSLAYILKEQMLQSIEQRHANEVAFQNALQAWKTATAEPEQHPEWRQFYANALRDELIAANKRKRNVNVNTLRNADWRVLVLREIKADDWFSDDAVEQTMQGPETAISGVAEVVPLAVHQNGTSPH